MRDPSSHHAVLEGRRGVDSEEREGDELLRAGDAGGFCAKSAAVVAAKGDQCRNGQADAGNGQG
jgi:hypothetical protein